MDINDLRALVTVAAFAAFVGIALWAWSGRRREQFEAAARLPFDGDEIQGDPRTAALARMLDESRRS